MANENRVRANFLGGTIDDNPLIVGATTFNSAALSQFPPISSTEHAAIVFDPSGSAGTPEIVHVTAHTAGATSATIVRGMEDTTAREHAQGVAWIHTATARDFTQHYNVIATNSFVANPTPTADTIVDGMTITVPASNAPRTFLVSAFCKFSAGHPNGFTPYLDSTPIISGSRIGSTSAESNVHHVSISPVVAVVPGDAATHTFTLQYNAIASTAATTFGWRTLTLLLVG